jgi:PTS system nitrogen regulatory IIA component
MTIAGANAERHTLIDSLAAGQVLPNLQARSKKEVLEELCAPVLRLTNSIDLNTLMAVLLERERLGSTGIGDGVAIPHGKLDGLDNLLMVFGRSRKGIDFDSLDGKPAYLFFLVLAPENSAGIHLKALARISRLLKSDSVRQEIMEAKDAARILTIINAQANR